MAVIDRGESVCYPFLPESTANFAVTDSCGADAIQTGDLRTMRPMLFFRATQDTY